MSFFGIRNIVKTSVKKVFGLEEGTTSYAPPSAPPSKRPSPRPRAVEEPEERPEDASAADAEGATPAASEEDSSTAAEAPSASAGDSGDEAEGPELSMEAVQEVLDDMVRPALQGDGGDITLLRIEDSSIYVQLVGACSTCPSSVMTMKLGVEALLREEFPSMKELVDVGAEA
jgi:Fe-S cluster biogenesis protein NfuA